MLKHLPIELAACGFAVTICMFLYLEFVNMDSSVAGALLLVLCPASLMSVIFIDFSDRSVELFVGWLIIAFCNAGLYALVGVLIRKVRTRAVNVARS